MSKIMSLAKKLAPPLAGVTTFFFAPPNPGWGSVATKMQAKQYKQALQSGVASVSGVRLGGIGGQQTTEIDIGGVLNPIDFRNAPTTKVVVLTKIAVEAIDSIGSFILKELKGIL